MGLDKNYFNQFVSDSKFKELMCSVFNLLIYNLLTGINIRFNQDNLDLINSVKKLLKLELNISSSIILSKLFNNLI